MSWCGSLVIVYERWTYSKPAEFPISDLPQWVFQDMLITGLHLLPWASWVLFCLFFF